METLQGEIERSLQTLGTTRERQSARLKQLSDFFDWTLKELLGPDAAGAIQIDAKGLNPVPGESVAATAQHSRHWPLSLASILPV